jgi:hypothetical protein
MVSNGTRLFVLGGGSDADIPADEIEAIHVLDTSMYSLSFHRTTPEFENRTHRDPETHQCCQA